MDFGLIAYGAVMLAISAHASAAGIGGPPASATSIHLASDCISDCQYRWLRCEKWLVSGAMASFWRR